MVIAGPGAQQPLEWTLIHKSRAPGCEGTGPAGLQYTSWSFLLRETECGLVCTIDGICSCFQICHSPRDMIGNRQDQLRVLT